MTIGTTSGDVRIDRADGSSIGVKCISGDVTLGLPAGIRVEPDISTLSGRTSLPTPSRTAPVANPTGSFACGCAPSRATSRSSASRPEPGTEARTASRD